MAQRVTFRYHINNPALQRLKITAAGEASQWAARKTRNRVRHEIRKAGRIDTGKMHNSITVSEARRSGNRVTHNVGSALPYTIYQNEGIGPVYPVRAKVLRFKPKGSSQYVFARRTKGFKGAKFYQKALAHLRAQDYVSD